MCVYMYVYLQNGKFYPNDKWTTTIILNQETQHTYTHTEYLDTIYTQMGQYYYIYGIKEIEFSLRSI